MNSIAANFCLQSIQFNGIIRSMIATVINALAVLAGSIFGWLMHKKISEKISYVVYTGVGLIALVLGISMALEVQRILYMALSLVLGGLIGTWINIENYILNFGEFLKRTFAKNTKDNAASFAHGFLDASLLFCVGALSLIGSFQAGAEGNYSLLLTKSVMDGFMAILLTAALGIGVAFSIITILVYQGALTLLSAWIRPYVTDLALSELTAVGGIMVIMIGFNMLKLRDIKTANYLPALIVVLICLLFEPYLAPLWQT